MFRLSIPLDDSMHRPIKKPKKRKPKKTVTKTYKLPLAKEELEQYYIGDICIGVTENVLTENQEECTATFNSTNDEDHLLLQFDTVIIVVKLAFDIALLTGIFTSKVISIKFFIVDEEFYIKLYFRTLPITNSRASEKLLKLIFHLIFDIEVAEEEGGRTTKLADPEDVLLLYKNLKKKHAPSVATDNNLQHSFLKPTLHPYQVEAVKWMLSRETDSKTSKILNPLFQPVKLPSSTVIYYDKYSGTLEYEEPLINSIRSGGILADEMGLGKTVEVLACILNNPFTEHDFNDVKKVPKIEYISRKRKLTPTTDNICYATSSKKLKNAIETSTYELLAGWYNAALDMTKTKRTQKRSIACICGNTDVKNVVICIDCKKKQHGPCVGYPEDDGDYKCSQCWMKMDNIPCKGTLIVCPISLIHQWVSEVQKHIRGNLSVLVYEGVCHSVVYPTTLKNYDLVITTYNVLQQELRLTENTEERNLRNPRKYSQGGSPIVNMKWWRLCLDEAQVIENRVMVTDMAKRLNAVHRWAITGTPISKNVTDIYALINYLEMEPYSEKRCWDYLLYKPYLDGNFEPMFHFLSTIMWRTCKIDVLDQISIPNLKTETHWLEFTEIEKYFYNCEYDIRYCDFLRKLKNYNQEMPLKALDNKSFKEIWAPFLALRQACVHHNALKGKYLTTTKTVSSMDNLLEALIEKNILENEEYLRVCISTLNGLAGIHLLLQNPPAAIEEYLKALKFIEKYNETSESVFLKVDTLQVIHVLHNLSEILSNFSELDVKNQAVTYKNQCLDLEKKYTDKHRKMTLKHYTDLMTEESAIAEIEKKFIYKNKEWYLTATNYIIKNGLWNDYCTKFDNVITGSRFGENDHFTNGNGELLLRLVNWNDKILKLRKGVLKKFKSICDKDIDQLSISSNIVMQAMDCHLRPEIGKRKSNKKDCALCVAKANLAEYESKLFDKKENKEEANVGVYKSSTEEIALKSIYNVIKSRNDEEVKDILCDAKNYMKLLEIFKNELKVLSKFYMYVDTEISCKDEINMSKMRFSLKEVSQECTAADKRAQKILKQLEMDIKRKNVYEIDESELDYQKAILRNQELQQIQNLDRNLGTYGYLNTLKNQQNNKGKKMDPCPICTSPLKENWTVLKCGHSFCIECIQKLITRHTNEKHVNCSICRQRQLIKDITYVNLNTQNNETCDIVGNVSTKLEAVVRLILRLRDENKKVKILVFSTWNNILNILQNVLEANGISSQLIRNYNIDKQLKNFKDTAKSVRTLLMPIGFGGKGLNIVEASHVIFLEALVDVGQELQAIGRIHRIGQLNESTVHKFIIRNTIEEKIYNAVTSDANKWNQNTMTLGQIVTLFNCRQTE